MTARQLNQRVKNLKKAILIKLKAADIVSGTMPDAQDLYHAFIEGEAKKEFRTIFYADTTFEYLSKESILTMLRLNVRYKFVELHRFGIDIELKLL